MERKKQRRDRRTDREREVLWRMEREYELFRCQMLSKGAEKVYDRCTEIYFYECLHEYFLYKEEISTEFLETVSKEPEIYRVLWEMYLKYEYLEVGTWENVDEMLRVYCKENSLCHEVSASKLKFLSPAQIQRIKIPT